MRQRKPESKWYFLTMFTYPLTWLFVIGGLIVATDRNSLYWLAVIPLVVLTIFVFWRYNKQGYFDALYAHYLKRWEEWEKAEAAKLYIGRKEE